MSPPSRMQRTARAITAETATRSSVQRWVAAASVGQGFMQRMVAVGMGGGAL